MEKLFRGSHFNKYFLPLSLPSVCVCSNIFSTPSRRLSPTRRQHTQRSPFMRLQFNKCVQYVLHPLTVQRYVTVSQFNRIKLHFFFRILFRSLPSHSDFVISILIFCCLVFVLPLAVLPAAPSTRTEMRKLKLSICLRAPSLLSTENTHIQFEARGHQTIRWFMPTTIMNRNTFAVRTGAVWATAELDAVERMNTTL